MSNIQNQNRANAEAVLAQQKADLEKIHKSIGNAGGIIGGIVGGALGTVLFPGVGTAVIGAIATKWGQYLYGDLVPGVLKKIIPQKQAWSKLGEEDKHNVIDGLNAYAVWDKELNLDKAKDLILEEMIEMEILNSSYKNNFYPANDWALNRLKHQIKTRDDLVATTEYLIAEMQSLTKKLEDATMRNIGYNAALKVRNRVSISPKEAATLERLKSHIQLLIKLPEIRTGIRTGLN